MSCKDIPYCAFYRKYKDDKAAKQAFLDNACEKNWPCARKTWKEQTGMTPGEDFTPAGTTIKKHI